MSNISMSEDLKIDRKSWEQRYQKTKATEIIRIPLIADKYELDNFLASINDLFVLASITQEEILLRKVGYPHEYTSAKELSAAMQKMQPLNSLFAQSFKQAASGQFCQLTKSKDAKAIGSGMQGTVYHIPSWRTDVVVKSIIIDKMAFTNSDKFAMFEDPKDGTYHVDLGLLEILASALINDFISGTLKGPQSDIFADEDKNQDTDSNKGKGGGLQTPSSSFLLFVPRFMGFFACPTMHIISERLPEGRLDEFLTKNQNTDMTLCKVLLFQTFYTILALNKLGYQHLDGSLKNFLLRQINPGETYQDQDISKAKHWRLVLDDETWSIQNLGWIAKITDFGFMIKTKAAPGGPPYLLIEQADISGIDPDYSINNESRPGYDISFIMLDLIERCSRVTLKVRKIYEVLFHDFAALAGIPKSENVIETLKGEKYMFARTTRPKFTLSALHFDAILNSSFFDEIREK
ncbi:MAG: hypothetical protein ACMG6E_01730 [Candidatus Roizmanbacteria bacterium]